MFGFSLPIWATKGVFKFIFSKAGAVVLGVLLFAFAEYRLWDAGRDAGVAEQSIKTAKVQGKLDALKAKIKHEADVAKAAAEVAHNEQAAVVKGLQDDLKVWKKKKAVVHTVMKEVIRYVTPKADAACTIPAGFVWLHDAAAKADAELALSHHGDADAPSGLALSAVTTTVTDNYALANDWRQQVLSWQKWYHENEGIIAKYNATIGKGVVPPSPGAEQ